MGWWHSSCMSLHAQRSSTSFAIVGLFFIRGFTSNSVRLRPRVVSLKLQEASSQTEKGRQELICKSRSALLAQLRQFAGSSVAVTMPSSTGCVGLCCISLCRSGESRWLDQILLSLLTLGVRYHRGARTSLRCT